MDRFLNAFIFAVTFAFTLGFFFKDGKWAPAQAAKAFRFFTVQSNVLCASAALLMCFASAQPWIWLLKYVGTAAVTVTMLTVFLFLGPSMGGYGELLKGRDFFLHLLTPLLALLSFCVFEKRGLSFRAAMWGLLPVVLYGALYLYKVVYAPAERRWEDFYGFNRGGKWPVAFAAMLLGGFLICLALMFLQNR